MLWKIGELVASKKKQKALNRAAREGNLPQAVRKRYYIEHPMITRYSGLLNLLGFGNITGESNEQTSRESSK